MILSNDSWSYPPIMRLDYQHEAIISVQQEIGFINAVHLFGGKKAKQRL